MAKTTETDAEPGDGAVHIAMKKTDFDACRVRFTATNNKIEEENKALNDFLTDAKKNKKLHPAAFKAAMKIKKMEEPKRGEYLFQLGTYLKWLKVYDQGDLLSDRQPADGEDDDRDLRPRNLRQGDAERAIDEAANKGREAPAPEAPDLTKH